MRNKKAQFFSLYLVILTVFMVSIALGFYFYQNSKLTQSLVPYSQVERIKLEQRTFEFNEINYLLDSVKQSKIDLGDSSWGKDEFLDSIKSGFVELLSNNLNSSDFILKNIIYNKKIVDYERIVNDRSYRESFLALGYTFLFVEINGEKVLNISRNFNKSLLLAGDRKKNSFPVELNYQLKKQYLINKESLVI